MSVLDHSVSQAGHALMSEDGQKQTLYRAEQIGCGAWSRSAGQLRGIGSKIERVISCSNP